MEMWDVLELTTQYRKTDRGKVFECDFRVSSRAPPKSDKHNSEERQKKEEASLSSEYPQVFDDDDDARNIGFQLF